MKQFLPWKKQSIIDQINKQFDAYLQAKDAEIAINDKVIKYLDAVKASTALDNELAKGIFIANPDREDLAKHYLDSGREEIEKARKKTAKWEAEAKVKAAEAERLLQRYRELIECYSRRQVYLDVALAAVVTVAVYVAFRVFAPGFPVIEKDYFSVTGQLFPVIFIALYFDKRSKINKDDLKWRRASKIIDGSLWCIYGTAVSLFALATGHGKFMALMITILAFFNLIPYVWQAVTQPANSSK